MLYDSVTVGFSVSPPPLWSWAMSQGSLHRSFFQARLRLVSKSYFS